MNIFEIFTLIQNNMNAENIDTCAQIIGAVTFFLLTPLFFVFSFVVYNVPRVNAAGVCKSIFFTVICTCGVTAITEIETIYAILGIIFVGIIAVRILDFVIKKFSCLREKNNEVKIGYLKVNDKEEKK